MSADGPTEVNGIISTNTTWKFLDSPYIVTGSILVDRGVTLTIEPGVKVKVNEGQYFKIEGYLIAKGTKDKHIVFSSNIENPDNEAWGGIYIRPTAGTIFDDKGEYVSGSVFDHVTIEHASAGLYVYATGILVTNSFFSNNSYAVGIRSTNNTIFTNNIFSNNLRGIGSSYKERGEDSNSYILNNKMCKNVFYNNGIGVYLTNIRGNIKNLSIAQNEFLDNSAAIHIGGGNDARVHSINVSNNWIHDNELGITFREIEPSYDEDTPLYQIIVQNNIIINNSGNPLSMGSTEDVRFLIERNSIANNDGGILLNDRIYANDQIIRYNSVIKNAYGILIDGTTTYHSKRWFFYGNTFFENSGNIFEIQGGSGYEISHNNFLNNGGYGIVTQISNNISVQENYWGTINTPQIDSMIYDYNDFFELGYVIYKPILTGFNTAAPISPPTGLVSTIKNYTIDLTWQSSPEPDVIGYKIYYDTDPGYPYNGIDAEEGASGIDVGDKLNAQLTISDNDRPDYIVITTYDSSGDESWYSNEVKSVEDSDGDGSYDNKDVYPHDPTQLTDRDGDGHGDNLTGNNSDVYPDDPTQWLDSDGDGYGNNLSGNYPDLFPFDVNDWEDFDADGYGDNNDAFPNDPAASVDLDGDKYPDYWNKGMSKKNSTTGLKIDKYPRDPNKYIDEPEDQESNIKIILLFIIAFLLMVFNITILIIRRSKQQQ